MDEEKLKKAAGLLKEVSDMLMTVRTLTSTSSRTDSSDSSAVRSAITTPIAETLSRARSMMNTSSSRGLYRRLNRNERLRATAESATKNKTAKTTKNVKKRPFEFALLRAISGESDEEDEIETLKKERIVERGMVILNEDDSESCVREKIVSSLKSEYVLLGPNDFDFVKVTQKKISVLRLAEGTEYNYSVVNKLAGQGLLYIRMKQAYNFVLNESDSGKDQSDWIDQDLLESHRPVQRPISTSTCHDHTGEFPITSITTSNQQTEESTVTTDSQRYEALTSQTDKKISGFFYKIISEFPAGSITEPNEMLRYLQSKIVQGRPLDVIDDATEHVGDTNFMAVDRDNILETTFDELRSVENPRITFQVEFYGEQAEDIGGPRKEWIRLCNQNIKTTYFDHGLKEHLADDYYFVRQMDAIALLQNGQAPKYFSEELLNDIFVSDELASSKCILKLRQGLDTLGIHIFARQFPMFLYLLRPTENNAKLTVPLILHLLKPMFSEEGSNSLKYEKAVYSKFVKYLRDVASGRRVTTLENILEFVTGASEEQLLGVTQQPSIHFMVPCVPAKDTTEDNTSKEQVNYSM